MNDLDEKSTPSDLVVVGSSAGGIEALSVLVGSLPQDFPAPIVLAQHLDPNRTSNLDFILQRRTTLPVEVVNSKSSLQVGRIYVVPANRHVSIHDHYVEVLESAKTKRPRPSVDTLLSTAAEAYGDHLYAVILTGSGSDGAVGVVDVKNAGGVVIVQNPHTARYPAMPMALPPTAIDFEVNLEQIGPLLYDLLMGVNIPQTEERTEDVLRQILEQVSHQASIDFRSYKTSTILRRVSRRMSVTGNRTMRDYLNYLKEFPPEVGELVKAFLINVTQFFRDAEAFAYIRHEVLPKLVERARGRDRVLRFWSAGCSTGEETYSLAMLVADTLGAELSEWSVKVFATDLDEAAINFARRGIYSENMLKGVSPDYLGRFFEPADHGFRISKMLRQMVIFGQQDLSKSAPFPRIDLVLCRNVLIYFTPELQEYVLNQFAFSLSPDGYLFLGKAETVRSIQSFYEQVDKHWKVYRCTGNGLPSLRRQSFPNNINAPRFEGGQTMKNQPGRISSKAQSDQEIQSSVFEVGQLRKFNEVLLRFLPIGVVIIDRTYRILTANGAARRLLGLRDMGIEQDFLHAVRGIPYQQTRTAIDAVFRERSALTLSEQELATNVGGNGRFLTFAISLMQMEAGLPDLAAISITDVTEQVQVRRQLENVQVEQSRLMGELSATNKRLSDVNKELMDTNEELQVANEELVLTHEELQASIEEFETTNEELQATNEELETNNEELQATNEELETTNEELRARTSELQELTTILESERLRLAEMVELAPFYIMVLRGPSLLVDAYNPRYSRLLEGRSVQSRPLDEVVDLFWRADDVVSIVSLCREAYRLDTPRRLPRVLMQIPSEAQDRYFSYTIVPAHDVNGRVDGVVIYATDETEQHEREANEERERLKLIFENAKMVALALYDAQANTLLMGSPRYLEIITQIYALAPQEIIGCSWYETPFLLAREQAAQVWKSARDEQVAQHIPELVYTFPKREEKTIWDYTITPIGDVRGLGSARFLLVSAVEVTALVQARQELEQIDRAKNEFVSLITHDLRTPLTSILGNAQLLQRKWQRQANGAEAKQEERRRKNSEQDNHLLERIIYQVQYMNRLVEQMLDVTRIQTGMLELHLSEPVDIVAFVRQIVNMHSSAGRTISFAAEEEPLWAVIDQDRMEQVLNNLLGNAIKYSPEGSPIAVRVERRVGEREEVVVEVRDKGYGIKEEDQAHVFDRFYRAQWHETQHIEGLGLGLYIAHEIVTRLGGRMWVESQVGEGSSFYVALPLADVAVKEKE